MLNVRLATLDDRDEVLRMVSSLLVELGGNPAPADALLGVFDDLAAGGDAGFIVIAEAEGAAKAVCRPPWFKPCVLLAATPSSKKCTLNPNRAVQAWGGRSSNSRWSTPWQAAAKSWSWGRHVSAIVR